jgi:serine/threonine-protein kinase HipA
MLALVQMREHQSEEIKIAKQNNKKSICVYAHWLGMEKPSLIVTLHSDRLKGNEVFSFEYIDDWLQSGLAQLLDPSLQLYSGLHLRRREAALSRIDEREEEKLFETDYLLGVYDSHRMGDCNL